MYRFFMRGKNQSRERGRKDDISFASTVYLGIGGKSDIDLTYPLLWPISDGPFLCLLSRM